MIASTPPTVAGLTGQEQAMLSSLWARLARTTPKNLLLNSYYDGHRALQDLGISMPPQMARTRAALGWPAKAVQALARKHVWEGYTLNGQIDPFDIDGILHRNDFTLTLMQAITAAYKHAVAFLTVAPGDQSAGEPPVVIKARDGLWTTAHWNARASMIDAALEITDTTTHENGTSGLVSCEPSRFILHTMDATIIATADKHAWTVERLNNPSRRIMVEPLVYNPEISRPFGHSRISREVRYLTDAAVRTLVRAETSAEFFASPQRYVLGVSADQMEAMRDRWRAITGRVLALSTNDEGETPTIGQFAQMSMDPHLSMCRQLAQNFCAATGLPQSSVGLFADNPASAEAMQAAEVALSDEAEYQWRVFNGPLLRILQDVLMVAENLDTPPAESWSVHLSWTPARYVSPQASSDFIVKTVSALPKVADTTIALQRAGFTTSEIEQMRAEWSRTGLIDRLGNVDTVPPDHDITRQSVDNGAPR
ncbi:phage portal protein [Cutibacterium sp.]|uniref:phage portal protein n=1 Tax=Cutibacterium sp. TaxID=1912221 RepID=UPI0026DBB191|nr:phage portal protein [Cutibacterium sp.]MDO4413059.1 phage portal protein [Cutibacterium sp.]